MEMMKQPNNKGSVWKYGKAYGLDDMYAHYLTKIKDGVTPLSRSEYGKICRVCNNIMAEMLVKEGRKVRVPYFGHFVVGRIHKVKDNMHPKIKYNHYNKTGEKEYHTNDHSEGWRASFRWLKGNTILGGISSYTFKAARDVAREISSEMNIPKGFIKYETFEPRKLNRNKLKHAVQ